MYLLSTSWENKVGKLLGEYKLLDIFLNSNKSFYVNFNNNLCFLQRHPVCQWCHQNTGELRNAVFVNRVH